MGGASGAERPVDETDPKTEDSSWRRVQEDGLDARRGLFQVQWKTVPTRDYGRHSFSRWARASRDDMGQRGGISGGRRRSILDD